MFLFTKKNQHQQSYLVGWQLHFCSFVARIHCLIFHVMSTRYYMWLVHLLAGITLGWMMFGCAPMKRHDRLVRKYPFVHTIDSVVIRDTFHLVVPEVRVDTMFSVDRLYDTITIQKEHLTAKVFRVRDSVYLVAQCDTIYRDFIREKKVPVTIYKKDPFWQRIYDFLYKWLVIAILIVIISKLIRKWTQQSFL